MPVDDITNLVQKMIQSDNAVIFSKSYCPFCYNVKNIFNMLDARYTTYELDLRTDGELVQNCLFKITGDRTVPQVFINKRFIGGSREIKQLYDDGILEKLIRKK